MGLFTRAIRPFSEVPNDNTDVAPGTVGPPTATSGDPHGLVIEQPADTGWVPPTIVPSAWSGWPESWATPNWGGRVSVLSDVAWECLDKNSSALSTMPPYLVNAVPSLNADWLNNPDPDLYSCWEEFAKSLFWDYEAVGEVFVLVTARYATGWPARFHVVPPWSVQVELDEGFRRYTIGSDDVTEDILQIPYKSTVDDAHGHGPLEAGAARLVAVEVLARYANTLASSGGIPTSILEHPEELSAEQAARLQAQWVQARISTIGEPAVLSGGVKWQAVQLDPTQMALVELSQYNEARIASMLGVPPFIVNLPSGGDSMTYSNVQQVYDFWWRGGLRPKAQTVMSALSGWALPRGTRVEVNRDALVQPGPLERAQTAQILNSIVDPVTGRPAMSVDEIREAERLTNSTPTELADGVLK